MGVMHCRGVNMATYRPPGLTAGGVTDNLGLNPPKHGTLRHPVLIRAIEQLSDDHDMIGGEL